MRSFPFVAIECENKNCLCTMRKMYDELEGGTAEQYKPLLTEQWNKRAPQPASVMLARQCMIASLFTIGKLEDTIAEKRIDATDAIRRVLNGDKVTLAHVDILSVELLGRE